MLKKIKRIALFAVIAFTVCMFVIPSNADHFHQANYLAHLLLIDAEDRNGPIGFAWNESEFKELSDNLYALDALCPLESYDLRMLAGQAYNDAPVTEKERQKAIQDVRNFAVDNKLLSDDESVEPYVISLRLFDAPFAPQILKVSLTTSSKRIVCGEIDEKGNILGLRELQAQESRFIPFVLDHHFLGQHQRPLKWGNPVAPISFWAEIEHRLLRCADVPYMIRLWKDIYGENKLRWPLLHQAVDRIWDEENYDGLYGVPQDNDLGIEQAKHIALKAFTALALDIYRPNVLARIEMLCEFKYGVIDDKGPKWFVWFVSPDSSDEIIGYAIIDAATAEIIDCYAGPGKG